MSKFYDELAALDRGIANRWKARSHDNPDFRLQPKDIEVILDPLMQPKGMIKETQVEAIEKLILEGKCTNDALAVLQV
jgi:hypothetical protein